MKKSQSTELKTQVAIEYLGPEWKKKLSTIQAALWEETFKSMDYRAAKESIRELFMLYPAGKNIFHFKMPDIDIVKEFYGQLNVTTSTYCPCCSNTGWIYFEKINKCVRCDCQSPEIECGSFKRRVGTLLKVFPDDPESKCDAFQCSPTKQHPCRMNIQFYNAKKIEWMERNKENPAFWAGLKILKGDIGKNLAEKIEDV